MMYSSMDFVFRTCNPFWWLYEAGMWVSKWALWLLLLDWWTPTTLVGKLIKFPIKWVGAFVAFPGTLTATSAIYALYESGALT